MFGQLLANKNKNAIVFNRDSGNTNSGIASV
jgi:hypothetical protein